MIEITDAPSGAKIDAVKKIASDGRPIPAAQLTNLRPAIDGAIIPAVSLNGETPEERKFATLGFDSSTDYLTDFPGYASYEIGGQSKNLFWHVPEYAAVQICATAKNDAGDVITPPKCDPLQPTKYIILVHDLGSLRQPRRNRPIAPLVFGLPVLGDDAGLHLVLALPPEVDDVALSERIQAAGVAVRPLSRYHAAPAQAQRGLLLGYACVRPEAIGPAFEVVARWVRVALKDGAAAHRGM